MRGCFDGNRGFENRSLRSVSFEQGVVRAEKVIKDYAVPFEQLEPVLGSECIRADKARVENIKESFKKKKPIDEYGTNGAKIFEAILHMRLKKGDWIDGTMAVKTNEFDDFVNGVDEVVRIPSTEGQNQISFAIDALTTGSGPLNVGIEKKMERIQHEITSGKLPSIKYFLDQETGAVGIPDIPRVVVAADMKTMQTLNDFWMERNFEELSKHPLQIQILEQIVEQSAAFSSFARKNNQDEIARKYDMVREWVKKKLAEKTHRGGNDWNDNASFVVSNALYPFKDVRTKTG